MILLCRTKQQNLPLVHGAVLWMGYDPKPDEPLCACVRYSVFPVTFLVIYICIKRNAGLPVLGLDCRSVSGGIYQYEENLILQRLSVNSFIQDWIEFQLGVD